MREARRMVLVAGLLGQLAAWSAGVLPLLVLPVSGGLLIAAALVAGRTDDRSDLRLRQVATGLTLVATVLALPVLGTQGAGAMREVLGPLLVAVQVVQALSWRVRRDLQLGLLVAVALLVLGASYAPDVLVGLPLVVGWAAGVAALVLIGAVGATGPAGLGAEPAVEGATGGDASARAVATGGSGVTVSGAVAPPVLPAVALALAVGLVAFLLLPPSTVAQSRAGLAAAGVTALSERARVFSSDRVDLRVRGQLSDRVLAQVSGDATPLWRSGSYDTYDGTAWTSSGRVPPLLSGPPFRVPNAPSGETTRAAVDLRDGRGTVWSPGAAVAVTAETRVARVDRSGAVLLPGSTPSYVVDSVPLETRPEVLRAAGPGASDGRGLQLPAALPDRVRVLAREITADAPTVYDKVRAVEQWLAASATYRLDPPVPGPGEDAVDRFLFVDRTGFCEHFAAAEVVLLRAVGIPARLVVGLAYGEAAGGGRRIFRENMLHAWVEVSYAGVGWAPSDPTAGAAQASVTRSVRARAAAALTSVLSVVDRVPGGRLAVAAALVVLGAVGWSPLVRRRPRRPAREQSDDLARAPGFEGRPALEAFLRWDAGLGPARRRKTESLTELRRRLDLAPSEAAALRVVERECFGADPPPAAETAVAVGVLGQR